MKIIILRHEASNFFTEAKNIEKKFPDGEWRHFKFSSSKSVLGIYENTTEGLEIHSDFFKYFYGQFSPEVENEFDVMEYDDFKSFCESLNKLLNEDKKILDLSVDGLWIWTVDSKELKLSPKLKAYLSY